MEVVFVHMKTEELRDHVSNCPLGPKDLSQGSYIVDGSLSNREDRVREPSNADWVQFLYEETFAKLFGKHRE